MSAPTPAPPASSLLRPRYWLTWISLGLLWSAARLPLALHPALAAALGSVMYHFGQSRRRIADTNLQLCFPELDATQRKARLRQHFTHLGWMALELGVAWWGSPQRLQAMAEFSGWEHLQALLDRGKPVLLLISHQTAMELGGQMLALRLQQAGHPLQVMYKPNRNALMERTLKRGRQRFTRQMIHSDDIRGLVKGLKNGYPSWYAPDQDMGLKRSIFVPFFGIPTATITMTSRITGLAGAALLPVSFERAENGKHIHIRIASALDNFPSGDDQVDTARINALLEEQIRRRPAQYFWVHRRFKTRPDGVASIYPQRRRRRRRT